MAKFDFVTAVASHNTENSVRYAIFAVFLGGVLLSGCATTIQPDATRMAPWTRQLRDKQPEEAFAAVYRWRGHTLVFLGANHSTHSDSPTFRLITQAFAHQRFDTLIMEGSPYSRGPDSPRDLEWLEAQIETDGFVQGGESVPAMRGALQQGARIWGGEADESVIRDRVLADGVSTTDLLGFYTLRSVPQWIREHRIEDGGDLRARALIESELVRNRNRLGLQDNVLPDYAAWAVWYEQSNGRPFDARFRFEEVGPLIDGDFASNRTAAVVGRARDAFVLETIAQHLGKGEDLLVVFGASHLTILRPALDHMLGSPCYAGSDITSAPTSCLG